MRRIGAGAVARGAGREVFGRGHLAGEVHVAGCGAAAVIRTRRTLGDFDLLGVEGIARDGAEIADAVDEDAALGVEAAHEDGIAGGGVAVLAEQERDAGRVAQRLGQRGGALLLQDFLADHGDGLRRVEQLLREFRRLHAIDFRRFYGSAASTDTFGKVLASTVSAWALAAAAESARPTATAMRRRVKP